MIPGTPLQLGAQEWLVPPLTLTQIEQLQPELEVIRNLSGAWMHQKQEALDAIVHVIGTALRRNFPDVTDDQLKGMLDAGNIGPAIVAVSGGSPISAPAATTKPVPMPNGKLPAEPANQD